MSDSFEYSTGIYITQVFFLCFELIISMAVIGYYQSYVENTVFPG